jgi:UDP-N-acetylmuramate dehydrogenase
LSECQDAWRYKTQYYERAHFGGLCRFSLFLPPLQSFVAIYYIRVRFGRGATALTLIQCFGASHPLPARSTTMEIKEQVPLAPYTTFQIGGPAAHFASVASQEELEEAIIFAKAKSLPKLILGGGSNVLISDLGFEGLVIQIHIKGIEVEEDTLIAGAGEEWDALVERAVTEGMWGIENLSNIPGTVGGAVVQNIGAYGAALSEVLKWAEVLDTQTGEVAHYTNEECQFEYRDSVFKHNPDLIVLRAALTLSREPKPNTSYKDLAARFKDSSLDLGAIRQAVIEIRKGKFRGA